jgi:hypothetical protein
LNQRPQRRKRRDGRMAARIEMQEAAGSQAAGKKQSRPSKDDLLYLVRVTGFEPAAS